jgi:UDP-2,3-diacylglucosamine pyrophosphatase LpxH
MLALLSDIHFCDATAQIGNVATPAFDTVLHEIYARAKRLVRLQKKPVHLDIVLLGDIFDLLRTERWFEDASGAPVPLSSRPWATPAALEKGPISPEVAARARAILDEAIADNKDSLATLRGERHPAPGGVEVRRVYIPGNHDRLYLHDAALRERMLTALGAVDGAGLSAQGIFLHRLQMPEYSLLARHGHEWDFWNFPSYRPRTVPSEYTDADYLPTPIGDAVTTELAARLPYELERRLREDRAFTPEQATRIHALMKRIEDVRPLMSAFHWAFYEIKRLCARIGPTRARALERAFDDTIRTIARDFRKLDFYRAWADECRDPVHFGLAKLLEIILCGMETLGHRLGGVAMQFDRLLAGIDPRDAARIGAQRESLDAVSAKGTRLVIYGHTHAPAQTALQAGVETEDVYLNTGTYRPGVFRTEDGSGFVGWQRLAYTIVHSEEETSQGCAPLIPKFVEWIGAAGLVPRAGDPRC